MTHLQIECSCRRVVEEEVVDEDDEEEEEEEEDVEKHTTSVECLVSMTPLPERSLHRSWRYWQRRWPPDYRARQILLVTSSNACSILVN